MVGGCCLRGELCSTTGRWQAAGRGVTMADVLQWPRAARFFVSWVSLLMLLSSRSLMALSLPDEGENFLHLQPASVSALCFWFP